MPEKRCVRAVWPIFANKCRCCVNQNLRENFEVRNIWVRTHGKFEAVSHEKALFLILSCFWGVRVFGKSSSLPAK